MNNLPAFPHEDNTNWHSGMTLRGYFAAKAMQAALSDPDCTSKLNAIAEYAYEVADAMLKEREKQ